LEGVGLETAFVLVASAGLGLGTDLEGFTGASALVLEGKDLATLTTWVGWVSLLVFTATTDLTPWCLTTFFAAAGEVPLDVLVAAGDFIALLANAGLPVLEVVTALVAVLTAFLAAALTGFLASTGLTAFLATKGLLLEDAFGLTAFETATGFAVLTAFAAETDFLLEVFTSCLLGVLKGRSRPSKSGKIRGRDGFNLLIWNSNPCY